MGKIIKFQKPSIEDEFFNSLNDHQKELYAAIMIKIDQRHEELYTQLEEVTAMYIEKIAECEELRLRLGE